MNIYPYREDVPVLFIGPLIGATTSESGMAGIVVTVASGTGGMTTSGTGAIVGITSFVPGEEGLSPNMAQETRVTDTRTERMRSLTIGKEIADRVVTKIKTEVPSVCILLTFSIGIYLSIQMKK